MSVRSILWVMLAFLAGSCRRSEPFEPRRPLRADSLERNGGARDCDLVHVALDLEVDLAQQAIEGSVTHTLRGLRDGTREVLLHAVGLEILGLDDGAGEELEWQLEEPLLRVAWSTPLARGEERSLRVRYRAKPEKGLYFVETSKDAAQPMPQAWSQGQAEDTRYWIPIWDLPNDRTSFEGRFRVPPGSLAISNGRLTETEQHDDGWTTYAWRFERSLATYLIALCVGAFEHYTDEWRGVPVDYWVGPGTGEEKARRAFGETPAMLEFFSQLTGVDYPYSKYAQVAVADFIYGGMENTTLTIQNDYIVGSQAEIDDLVGDPRLLVAHEAAHQWFGDLVTCRGWSDLWLNEAFASYLELLFEEHAAGRASFHAWLEEYRQRYLARGDRTRLPLSEDWHTQLTAERCTHEYTKGPWVLHMLAESLGREVFWQAVRRYLADNAEGLVTTADLIDAFFDETGHNVEGFLEQWVEAGGHPVLEARLERSKDRVEVHLRQLQGGPDDQLVPLFDVPLTVEFAGTDSVRRERLRLSERELSFSLQLTDELVDVVIDPDGELLCDLRFDKPDAMWLRQAQHASVSARWRALEPLAAAAKSGPERARAADSLERLVAGDPQYLLRSRAARVLGASRATEASERLLAAFDRESDPRVRQSILAALRKRTVGEEGVATIVRAAEEDPSPRVRSLARELAGLPED